MVKSTSEYEECKTINHMKNNAHIETSKNVESDVKLTIDMEYYSLLEMLTYWYKNHLQIEETDYFFIKTSELLHCNPSKQVEST